MIAFQTTNQPTTTLNRAPDGSRASRSTSPQETINQNATAHKNPSPVADGGGAEPCEAEGVFDHPTDPRPTEEKRAQTQIPTLPKGKNIARFMDAFLDGSFSIPSICNEFELTLNEVLALIESPDFQNALNTRTKIAKIREQTIATQARVTVIHRLNELATYAHTADAANARAFETARKSAAQIIRTTNPKRKSPTTPRTTPRASRRSDELHNSSIPKTTHHPRIAGAVVRQTHSHTTKPIAAKIPPALLLRLNATNERLSLHLDALQDTR